MSFHLLKIVTVSSSFAIFLSMSARADTRLAPPPFSVAVTLSQKAAEKLQASGETITVAAQYFGYPINSKNPNIADDGNLYFGTEKIGVSGAGSVTLGHVNFALKELAQIKDHNVSVNINVFTSRKVFVDNLLDCDIFEDTVTVAAAKTPISLSCKLIGE